jgi:hypothetical protein
MDLFGIGLLELLVVALAAARITRIVTTDTVGQPIRLAFSRWDWGRELVHCPWCIGTWISLAVVALFYILSPSAWFTFPAVVLAVSHLVGLLDTAFQPDDIEIVVNTNDVHIASSSSNFTSEPQTFSSSD